MTHADPATALAALEADPTAPRTIEIDARRTPAPRLVSGAIEELGLRLRRRPPAERLRLEGSLPALRRFSLDDRGATTLDHDALGALLSTARPALTRVELRLRDPWPCAIAIARALDPASSPLEFHAEFSADTTGEQRSDAMAHLRELLALGARVDPRSLLALLDRAEHLPELAPLLAGLAALDLEGKRHRFLLESPALLAAFPAVRRLEAFDAQGLADGGLQALCNALPALEELSLINNEELTELRLESATLVRARFAHFHALRAFSIDAPRLTRLELDNCDAEAIEQNNRREGVGMGMIYGNLSERLLAALLDGAPGAALPALRELVLWNNPYGAGPLLAIEALRVDVACLRGHPTLEALRLANLPHLRSLRLRSLPALRELHISQSDDEGSGTTWLAEARLDGLPAGCAVEHGALSPGRAGLGAKATGGPESGR